MKRIKNANVRLSERMAKVAAEAGIAVVDTFGVFTTTAHFLCGENPWGLHQDYAFSLPLSHVRMGKRIERAAELAMEKSLPIELFDDEHATLLRVLASPRPSATTPMHPQLAREVAEIFAAIEMAEESKP